MSACPTTAMPAPSAVCSPKPMSPQPIAARGLSGSRPISRRAVRSCATSLPRIAAAIWKTWRCSICLVTARLGREADALRAAEGWKWTEPHLDFPHAHGMRRAYPHPVELSAEDQAALQALQTEFDWLTEQHQTAEELPDEVDARFGELETQIEQLEAKRQAYDPGDVARGGAFVILNHDGTIRIERGFIRPEDDKSHAEAGQDGDGQAPDEEGGGDDQATRDGEGEEGENEEEDEEQKLSDTLVRDLTAHRTLGLRLNLSEQPDVAIVAVTHALAAQIFYIGANAHVVGIQPVKTDLATHAVGIEDTPAGKAWSDRHANWARQMPRDVAKLWEFVVELDHDSRMALFAHCTALTVNAVKLPFDLRPRALAAASRLAEAVALDMTGYWRPTVQSYLGRVTKAGILEAVREGVGEEAAERIVGYEKGRDGGSRRAAIGGNRLVAAVAAHGQDGGSGRCARRGARRMISARKPPSKR